MTNAGRDVGTPRPSARPVVMATASTVAGGLPLFLVGALAAQLTEELVFGAAALGAAVGLAQAIRAGAAAVLGRVVDRLGASRSLRLAMLASAMSAAGIAFFADSWGTLVPWLMLTAVAHAMGQPAANRLMVNRTRPERLGTAFGIKQAAPPTATMLAGLSVPVLAVTVGWRWAYGFAAVLALVVALFIRRPVGAGHPERRAERMAQARVRLHDPTAIAIIAAGFGMAFAASAVVLTFYVDANVAAGGTASFAGVLLACASVAAIATRLSVGIACDRTAVDPLRICAGLLLVGALGHVLLAFDRPGIMGAGILVALVGTWGFASAFWVAIMRAYAATPGRVTGAMAPGVFLGGVVGPVLFGLAVEHISYPVAWVSAALVAVAAAVTFLLASRRLSSQPATLTAEG